MLHQPPVSQILERSYFLTRDKAESMNYLELIVHSCTYDLVLPLGQASCLLALFLGLPLCQQGDRAFDSPVLKCPIDTADGSRVVPQRPIKRKKFLGNRGEHYLPSASNSKCLFNGLLQTGAEFCLFWPSPLGTVFSLVSQSRFDPDFGRNWTAARHSPQSFLFHYSLAETKRALYNLS